jgi:CDP-glucose 4,6-dehydratase
MENSFRKFFKDKTILVTGHTGFKGGWLAVWLKMIGATVIGFSLPPEDKERSLFEVARIDEGMVSIMDDVRDATALEAVFKKYQPDIVFHLAAQALVRRSYRDPAGTYATNVMGTVNLLEAIRHTTSVRAVVIVTSDKCYENQEWPWGYREVDALGGYDPYSSSKGCVEIVTAAYRKSFFPASGNTFLASARAGNVIGGGDWAEDRIVPDIFRAISRGRPVIVRNPGAIRPWQHVLEPLRGYMVLSKHLWTAGATFAEAWNFGPGNEDSICVNELAERIVQQLGKGQIRVIQQSDRLHETHYLKLDCNKAKSRLHWLPLLSLNEALKMTVEWYQIFLEDKCNVLELTTRQIRSYMERMS